MDKILLTNVSQYAGPGILDVLLRQGSKILCHDAGFSDSNLRREFEKKSSSIITIAAQKANDIFAEASAYGDIDGLILNDVFPNKPQEIGQIDIGILRNAFEALLVFPFQLSQLFFPAMKKRSKGSIVFITSARELQPEPGFAVATTIRAGTTAFSKALAKEAAPFNISVNTVAPNYLYSEAYYPRARFVESPEGQTMIKEKVPFGRLGNPEEMGELVAFLISGRSPFTTGQVIHFTGGWP